VSNSFPLVLAQWSVSTIIFAVIGGLVLLVVVGFSAALFLSYLFEKRRLQRWEPVRDGRDARLQGKVAAAVESARERGFRDAGVFSDGDAGWKEGLYQILLSPDRRTLMWARGGSLAARYRLISAADGGRWLVTTNVRGETDFSGLTEEMELPHDNFEVVWRFHQVRLAQWPRETKAFDERSLGKMFLDRERLRARELVKRGLARFVDPAEEVFVHTFAAAKLGVTGFFSDLGATSDNLRRAEQKAKEYGLDR
jgi:hypothetical protein